MAGGVEECDVLTVEVNSVSTDVLCDTARLAACNVRMADSIEKRCFTVVNVTHYANNGASCFEVFFRIFNLVKELIFDCNNNFFCNDSAHFFCNEKSRIVIDNLVNRCHNAHHHKLFNDFSGSNLHKLCELANRDFIGDSDLNRLCLLCFIVLLSVHHGSFALFALCIGVLLGLFFHFLAVGRHIVSARAFGHEVFKALVVFREVYVCRSRVYDSRGAHGRAFAGERGFYLHRGCLGTFCRGCGLCLGCIFRCVLLSRAAEIGFCKFICLGFFLGFGCFFNFRRFYFSLGRFFNLCGFCFCSLGRFLNLCGLRLRFGRFFNLRRLCFCSLGRFLSLCGLRLRFGSFFNLRRFYFSRLLRGLCFALFCVCAVFFGRILLCGGFCALVSCAVFASGLRRSGGFSRHYCFAGNVSRHVFSLVFCCKAIEDNCQFFGSYDSRGCFALHTALFHEIKQILRSHTKVFCESINAIFYI